MFPLLGQGEVPNQVSVLLDGTRYLHVQVGNSLYQFEGPARESVVCNIDARVSPPLTGTNPPGTVCLFNTVDELNELYALVAQELDEHDSPNTRMGQRQNKCEEYRKAHQTAHDGTHAQCGVPPPPSSFVPEVQQPTATSVSSSVLEAPQPPAPSSSPTAPRTACP